MKYISKLVRTLAFIVFALSTLSLFSQTEAAQQIDKVQIGMSQKQALSFAGEPSNKFILGEGPEGTIEVWHYTQDEEIIHAIEFIGGKVEKVIEDYEAYQKELKQLMEK